MLSYTTYKIIHFTGLLMLFLALGGFATHYGNGGTRNHPWRKKLAITHGVGLLFILVSGFGMLAKLQLNPIPTWIYSKLSIWVLLGASIAIISRKPKLANLFFIACIALGVLAVFIVLQK